ncbi:secreted protein [Beggiatoa sp. PS]|nr:secreted protein [Beggiatoa sp. PS]
MKKVLFAAFAVFFTSSSYAWEAYEFDISYISTVNDTCQIGMTNLGAKSSNDEKICDTPTAIFIPDCTTERAKVQMSIILAAK